jgi:hypothetical protein
MVSNYCDIQNRISTELQSQQTTRYYFAIRTKKNNCGFSKWKAFISEFVLSGNGKSSVHGEFLSSSWFKINNPTSCECAIIKISTDTSDRINRNTSSLYKIADIIRKMNCTETILSTKEIVLFHMIKEEYFDDIAHLLKTQMYRNNNEYATIHSSMNNERGVFGLSFGMRKGKDVCMYCPNFTLSS